MIVVLASCSCLIGFIFKKLDLLDSTVIVIINKWVPVIYLLNDNKPYDLVTRIMIVTGICDN